MTIQFNKLLITIIGFQCVTYSTGIKVAIVGGGIGGASSAHHLRRLLGSNVEISVYDGGPIGGRAHSVNVDGQYYEGGASIIHKRNRYVRGYVQMLNLTECDQDGKIVLSVFNGVKPAFVGSPWSWINTMKLLWRYGPDLFRIQWTISEMLNQFDHIYKLQEDGNAFSDVDSLISKWNKDIYNFLNQSLADWLTSKGFSERFIDELANAATRNNYNQHASTIHAFVGQVSLAGFLPGLFSIRGGNSQVVEKLLKATNVRLISSMVTAIEEMSGTVDSPLFSLHLTNGEVHKDFNFVILAAPRYQGSTTPWPRFINVEPDLIPIDATPYQPVTATFVRGSVNVDHFRLPDGQNYTIFMSGRAQTNPVNSIGAHKTVDGCGQDSPIAWKVFSNDTEPLPSESLAKMFKQRDFVQRQVWSGAYPRYTVPTKTAGLRFVLAPGLICLYPMEQLASAMEMSAISGTNAALLVYHASQSNSDKIHGMGGSGRREQASASSRQNDEL